MVKITELKEANHKKEGDNDALKEKLSLSMRYLEIEEKEKIEERERKQ